MSEEKKEMSAEEMKIALEMKKNEELAKCQKEVEAVLEKYGAKLIIHQSMQIIPKE